MKKKAKKAAKAPRRIPTTIRLSESERAEIETAAGHVALDFTAFVRSQLLQDARSINRQNAGQSTKADLGQDAVSPKPKEKA